VLVLDAPLVPEADYVVTVTGVRNIAGVDGGAGEAGFTAPPRPAPPGAEPAPPDTVFARAPPGGVDTPVTREILSFLRNTVGRYGVE
jgi:hypothetical protein